MSPEDRLATDIILDGQDPALPDTTKMTMIVSKGGLEETSLGESKLAWLL